MDDRRDENEENMKKNEKEKKIRKRIILSIAFGSSGCFIFIILFVLLVVVIFVASGDDDKVVVNNRKTGRECGFTISSTSLSKSEYKKKIQEYANSHSQWQVFADNADAAYDYATSIGVNPELVVTVAMKEGEGYVVQGRKNNYWGLNCPNGEEAEKCNSYDTFMQGAEAILNSAAHYETLYDWFAKGNYSYIGYFWYNPGGWGVGGCAYASYIYADDMPSRVANACSAGAPACEYTNSDYTYHQQALAGANPRSGCTVTTDDDQIAYTNWLIKSKMGVARKEIFGLEFDDGPCATNFADRPLTNLKESIEDYVNPDRDKVEKGSSWAVYVKNLKSRTSVFYGTTSYGVSAKFSSPNFINLFLIGAIYDEIEKGTISEENVNNYLEKAVVNHDIGAINYLYGLVGRDKINNYAERNNYNNVVADYPGSSNNIVSVASVAKFLEDIYDKKFSYSEKLLKLFEKKRGYSALTSGIHNVSNDVDIAFLEYNDVVNQNGVNVNVMESTAIVYDGGDYIVVLTANGISDFGLARTNVEELSKMIYEYYKGE